MSNRCIVNRISEDELEKAIVELESRGFRVVKRFMQNREQKFYNYKDNAKQKFRYRESATYVKFSAVMERVSE